MSPIVAVLLHVRDVDVFVATFVTMYSGLIPMFSTAGNTTNDGLVGALLNDRFCTYLKPEDPPLRKIENETAASTSHGQTFTLATLIGWILLVVSGWMFVSPQALLGLDQLKWMHRYAFPAEVLLGALVMSVSLRLLAPEKLAGQVGSFVQQIPPAPAPRSAVPRH
jgi:hypothetical protein